MHANAKRTRRTRLAILAGGSTFFLGGCDPEIQTMVEDGVITTANTFFSSLLQAFFQVMEEAENTTAAIANVMPALG